MSYGIVRVQKFASGSVKGVEIHDEREKGKSHTNPDIDWTKTHLNYNLNQTNHETFRRAIKDRINKLNLKRAVRKDAIVMAQVLVTSDRKFFDGLSEEQTKDFFTKSYEFLKDRYGKENVVSAIVHMDEKTPHMHFNFVPVTDDGRLSAKSLLNRIDLIKQQDDFHKEVGKEFGLDRGVRGGAKKHLEVAEFKKQTAYKEVEQLKGELAETQKALKRSKSDLKELEDAILEITPFNTYLGGIEDVTKQFKKVTKTISRKEEAVGPYEALEKLDQIARQNIVNRYNYEKVKKEAIEYQKQAAQNSYIGRDSRHALADANLKINQLERKLNKLEKLNDFLRKQVNLFKGVVLDVMGRSEKNFKYFKERLENKAIEQDVVLEELMEDHADVQPKVVEFNEPDL